MSVDRTEIAVLISPLVPDGHVVVVQVADIGIALQKPQQLVNDGAQMQFLGGDQRKPLGEIEAHLVAEHADRTGAGTILLAGAVVAHMAHQV